MSTYGAALLGARLLAVALGVQGMVMAIRLAASPLSSGQWTATDWLAIGAYAAEIGIAAMLWRGAPRFAAWIDQRLLDDGTDEPVDPPMRHRSAAAIGIALLGIFVAIDVLPHVVTSVGDAIFDLRGGVRAFDESESWRDYQLLVTTAAILQLAAGLVLVARRHALAAWIIRTQSPAEG